MVFLHGSVDEHLVRDVIALFKVVGLEILFHGGGGFQKNLGGAFADGLPGGALGNGFLPCLHGFLALVRHDLGTECLKGHAGKLGAVQVHQGGLVAVPVDGAHQFIVQGTLGNRLEIALGRFHFLFHGLVILGHPGRLPEMLDGLLAGNEAGSVAVLAVVEVRAVLLLHEHQVITVVGTHDHLGKVQQGNGAAVLLHLLVQGGQAGIHGAQLHAQAFGRFRHGRAGRLFAAVSVAARAEGTAGAVFPVGSSFTILTVKTAFPPGLASFAAVAPRTAVASLPVAGPAFRIGRGTFLTGSRSRPGRTELEVGQAGKVRNLLLGVCGRSFFGHHVRVVSIATK